MIWLAAATPSLLLASVVWAPIFFLHRGPSPRRRRGSPCRAAPSKARAAPSR